jgi:hypothetical protein
MILASISGGQSLGKPLPDLSRQGQSLCEGPFSVSCRKSKPFKPSDAVGFDEKSRKFCRFSILELTPMILQRECGFCDSASTQSQRAPSIFEGPAKKAWKDRDRVLAGHRFSEDLFWTILATSIIGIRHRPFLSILNPSIGPISPGSADILAQ